MARMQLSFLIAYFFGVAVFLGACSQTKDSPKAPKPPSQKLTVLTAPSLSLFLNPFVERQVKTFVASGDVIVCDVSGFPAEHAEHSTGPDFTCEVKPPPASAGFTSFATIDGDGTVSTTEGTSVVTTGSGDDPRTSIFTLSDGRRVTVVYTISGGLVTVIPPITMSRT